MNNANIVSTMIGKLNPPGTLIFSNEAGFLITVSSVFLERVDINVALLNSSSNEVIVSYFSLSSIFRIPKAEYNKAVVLFLFTITDWSIIWKI